MAKKILLLNGPNLNLLGQRQPEIYGHESLDDVSDMCAEVAAKHSIDFDAKQSNHEGQLVDWVQEARGSVDAIVVNPGAYSHTSIALLDAFNAYEGVVVEIHVSNIHAREEFRHNSYISGRADAVIAGCGVKGYDFAMQHAIARIGG